MPIPNVPQPDYITVDNRIRLRKFDDHYDFALAWYQDEDTNFMVDGRRGAYDFDQLSRRYHYLEKKGEVYFIEILEDDVYHPIGDVTFWQEDMPIVIGDPNYRSLGIGKKVISTLIERGKSLGYSHLEVGEIYNWNLHSQKCFECLGFRVWKRTEKGASYRLELEYSSKLLV